MTDRPLYVYCVTRAGQRVPKGCGVVEPSTGPLRSVPATRTAVLASPVEDGEDVAVRMTPSNLQSHHAVVEAAFAQGTVLPFRFGLVVEGADRLGEFLEGMDTRLGRMLERFGGLGEVRVTARYVGEAALREAATDPRIARLRGRIRGRPEAATYYDRIELGEAVAGALERLRAEDGDVVSAPLRRATLGERRLEPNGTDVVLRAAYLLDTSRIAEFDTMVSALGEEHRGRIELASVGPLAPWDFVELDGVERRPASRLRRARAGA